MAHVSNRQTILGPKEEAICTTLHQTMDNVQRGVPTIKQTASLKHNSTANNDNLICDVKCDHKFIVEVNVIPRMTIKGDCTLHRSWKQLEGRRR